MASVHRQDRALCEPLAETRADQLGVCRGEADAIEEHFPGEGFERASGHGARSGSNRSGDLAYFVGLGEPLPDLLPAVGIIDPGLCQPELTVAVGWYWVFPPGDACGKEGPSQALLGHQSLGDLRAGHGEERDGWLVSGDALGCR